MKRAALLMLTLLVATGLTYAMFLITTLANGSVKGKITEKTTKEAIPGATVQAFIGKESKGAVAADLDGNYNLSLAPGVYTFEVKSLGFEKKIIENVKVEDNKAVTLDIEMTSASKSLGVVVVSESKYSKSDDVGTKRTSSYSVDTPAESSTISYDAVTTPGYSTGSVMESAPGVSVTSGSRSISKSSTYKSAPSKEVSDKKSLSVVKGKSTRLDVDKDTDAKALVREPDTRAGQLTAGEWSDNLNWDFFDGVRKKNDWKGMEPNWGFDLGNRYYVKVTSGGKPQNDVKVVLKDKKGKTVYEGRSDNNGNCYLFAGLFEKETAAGGTIEVATSGGTKTIDAGSAGNIRPITVDISRSTKAANKLDIMFMIDATGSMGDEINYLKEELSDVVRRVKAESEQMVDIRVSANVYRDKGDEYVVRSFPFTNDMSKVLTNLSAQYAGGGGDFEEAVEEGLDDGINKHDWSEDATARIMFLVLDAPPHNTPENKAKIQKAVTNAAKKGIRIIPVTSSGIDKNTEFLMRFLSIATGGTYVFLTDHSGIGNSHIEPTIGKYDVEYLNNLMVRLIKAYLTTES
jgi:hypothetical protein